MNKLDTLPFGTFDEQISPALSLVPNITIPFRREKGLKYIAIEKIGEVEAIVDKQVMETDTSNSL